MEAAQYFGRTLSGQVSASIHIPKAKVIVIGTGKAASAAAKQAATLGGQVQVSKLPILYVPVIILWTHI